MKYFTFFFTCLVLFSSTAGAWTLEDVRERDILHCGVSADSPGFSRVDDSGKWIGLDVDICRAVAAAVLGDAEKVQFVPLGENGAMTALLSDRIDLFAGHGEPWNFTRDTALPVDFTGISYYDEQGLAAGFKEDGVELGDLKNVTLCLAEGKHGQRVHTLLKRQRIPWRDVSFDTEEAAVEGFLDGRCNLISQPFSQLQALVLEREHGERAVILPDSLGRVAFGPVVRQGDDVWFDIVRWSFFAMIDAEALGLSSKNAEQMMRSARPEIRRFFGIDGGGMKSGGLTAGWTARIVRQVGNYGESFERNLGEGSSLKMERGRNKLWKDGGLIYAPPVE